MKYRIFLIKHGHLVDIELHNLHLEAIPGGLAYTVLKQNITPSAAMEFGNQLQAVIGADCCDIVPAKRTS